MRGVSWISSSCMASSRAIAASASEGDETPVSVDERPQPRVLHREFTKLILPRDDAGIGQQAADFLESLVEFLEFSPDGVLHGREL